MFEDPAAGYPPVGIMVQGQHPTSCAAPCKLNYLPAMPPAPVWGILGMNSSCASGNLYQALTLVSCVNRIVLLKKAPKLSFKLPFRALQKPKIIVLPLGISVLYR